MGKLVNMEVLFVTGNPGKFREASEILSSYGIRAVRQFMELEEIQDRDVLNVSAHKARKAFEKLKKPLFVEDTGLYISGLNGYPGSFVKHFLDSIGMKGITKCLYGKKRMAKAVCVVTYADRRGSLFHFTGEVPGRITWRPSGESNFGFDPIFVPDGKRKTFAKMSAEEKNEISHRRKALEKFASWLNP